MKSLHSFPSETTCRVCELYFVTYCVRKTHINLQVSVLLVSEVGCSSCSRHPFGSSQVLQVAIQCVGIVEYHHTLADPSLLYNITREISAPSLCTCVQGHDRISYARRDYLGNFVARFQYATLFPGKFCHRDRIS